MFLFLPIVQKRGCMPFPLGEEALALTSSGHGRIVNLKCLFLSLPTRMGKSLTRT